MDKQIREIIDAYEQDKNPINVDKAIREYVSEKDIDTQGVRVVPCLERESIREDKERLLQILLSYVCDVFESPGDERSPYWIIFCGFEGENGDLSKEDYELFMKYKGILWNN